MDISRKKKQYIGALLLAGLCGGIFLIAGQLMQNDSIRPLTSADDGVVDTTVITDRTSAASPEMSWITTGRQEIERLTGEAEEERNLRIASEAKFEKALSDMRGEFEDIVVQQAEKIASLEGGAGATTSADANQSQDPYGDPGQRGGQAQTPNYGAGQDFISPRSTTTTSRRTKLDNAATTKSGGKGSFGVSFSLTSRDTDTDGKSSIKTLGNYIPAGSYAPAVVLSGADAATNVASRENPIPVILRITGPAVTASVGGGRPKRIDIRGCILTGSAVGDLSSERVKVRLINMTCTNSDDEVLEVKVAGYIAGSGKEGVRGKVVSREGRLVTNAAIAGALGGLAGGVSGANDAGLGSDTESGAFADRAAKAVGAGAVEGAASVLTDYYINRAEQYQPVVSLYANTKVEIVFIEGVDLS